MLTQWKEGLHKLMHDRPGRRFSNLHERQQGKSAWLRWAYPVASLVCLAVGVVLVFIPGPAFVFFALALGLLAIQSRRVAERLDRGELWARSFWRRRHPSRQ